MHRKLREFFETKGRRLAELKAAGGQEFMILGQTKRLTPVELAEFRTLTIQMDSVIWALEPKDPDKRESYIYEINCFFAKIEAPYFEAQEVKGGKKILRGRA
jgi:hypothetical protein